MKTMCLSVLAFLIYHSAVLADDVVIVLPNQTLLDETAHIRGTKASSDWSTITIQIDAITGDVGDKYNIGTYSKFNKDIAFDLGEGAEYLASVNALNQQSKALLKRFLSEDWISKTDDGLSFIQELGSLKENIEKLETKSPLKDVTENYFEMLADTFVVIQAMKGSSPKNADIAQVRKLYDSINFDLFKSISEIYKPYIKDVNQDNYPLTFLVGALHTANLFMVTEFINRSDANYQTCNDNDLQEYCLLITRKALSVEPLFSDKRAVMRDYCLMALTNDWMTVKRYASPVDSMSDAKNQYSMLRLRQLNELPDYMNELSATAKSCLISFMGNVTTELVVGTPAYQFYEKEIQVAEQKREVEIAALNRLIQDSKSQYRRVVDEIVGENLVDSNQANGLYEEAINTTLEQLKRTDNYKRLTTAELHSHLPIADIRTKIQVNTRRISRALSKQAVMERGEEILLQKELEHAKTTIRSSVINLTKHYGSAQNNLDELNQSIIESFDKLANAQFAKNNKPVEQLAAGKRAELLKTVNKEKLLSEQGANQEFQRLIKESESFANRIGIPIFEDKHIKLLELKKHKYKLSMKESARQTRYKTAFNDDDKWLWSATCDDGDVSFEFNIHQLNTMNIRKDRYKFTIKNAPFLYKGYGSRGEEIKPVKSEGSVNIQYIKKEGRLHLTMFRMKKEGIPRGYRQQYITRSYNFKFGESRTDFIPTSRKRSCNNETFELIQSSDLHILKYESDTEIAAE